MKEIKEIRLYNKGGNTIQIDSVTFSSHTFCTLPEKEALKLLAYPHIIRADEMEGATNNSGSDALNLANARIKELEEEIAKLTGSSEDIEEIHNEREALENEALALGLIKGKDFKFNTPLKKMRELISEYSVE